MMTPSRRLLYALTAAVAAVAFVLAARLDSSTFLTDDGGITLRYAERISQGRGFNYNDGESVNGASNPLYTLLLAAWMALGLGPEAAIRAIALPAYTAATALVFYAFARYRSLFAGLFGIVAFWSCDYAFAYMFDALEPTLALLFAAALFHAMHTRNAVYQGVVLGLLVANKLDGAFAAIAFALVHLIALRRFPLRVALIALAAALPVFAVLFWCFGSILPNSALAKVQGSPTPGGFRPEWMIDSLRLFAPFFWWTGALAFLLPWRESFPRVVIQVWLLAHLAAYSVIDLGAPYPWYNVLPVFLLVLLSTEVAHAVFHGAGGAPADAGALRRTASRALPVAAVLTLFLLFTWPGMSRRLSKPPDWVPQRAASDLARQAAGAWLRKHTSGSELFWSHFGLPCFEYKGPVYDGSLLNSKPDPTALARAQYALLGPFEHGQAPPRSFSDLEPPRPLVATFQYAADADMYALYAAPRSEIVQNGLCHVVLYFRQLPVRNELIGEVANPGADFAFPPEGLYAPAPSRLSYTVECPCPPTLAFVPGLRSRTGALSGVRARIEINGEVVWEAQVEPGAEQSRQMVRPSQSSPEGIYRIVFVCEPLDPAAEPKSWVGWRYLSLAAGEPLSSRDFSALCDSWARRVDRVEGLAIPP
jgi:hypothetical protein